MSDAEDLANRIGQLSPMGVRFVARVVDAMSNPPQAQVGKSWIGDSAEWIEYFGLAIAGHHGLTVEPLGLVSFEVAFRNACAAIDWQVSDQGSATQRFVDTWVDVPGQERRNLSLKSTAARNLSKRTVHISKLTEAAWIQDMRSAKSRRSETLKLFEQYRSAVDAIVMLRAFRTGAGVVPSRYQLIEVPTEIFASLDGLTNDAFAADGPTLPCSYGGHDAAAFVLLDRSDAKITVKRIRVDVCTVHAEWELVPVT